MSALDTNVLARFFVDDPDELEHHFFGYVEDVLFEHGSYSMSQPVIQFGAAAGIRDRFETEADFGDRDGADQQVVQALCGDESAHGGTRARLSQLGNDIRVEQPPSHILTERTGIAERRGSKAKASWGAACSASINASPVLVPLSRLNSSASTTTTASRP